MTTICIFSYFLLEGLLILVLDCIALISRRFVWDSLSSYGIWDFHSGVIWAVQVTGWMLVYPRGLLVVCWFVSVLVTHRKLVLEEYPREGYGQRQTIKIKLLRLRCNLFEVVFRHTWDYIWWLWKPSSLYQAGAWTQLTRQIKSSFDCLCSGASSFDFNVFFCWTHYCLLRGEW